MYAFLADGLNNFVSVCGLVFNLILTLIYTLYYQLDMEGVFCHWNFLCDGKQTKNRTGTYYLLSATFIVQVAPSFYTR